jgi:hypothetical protein
VLAIHASGVHAPWLGSAPSGTPRPLPSHHSGNRPACTEAAAARRGGWTSVWYRTSAHVSPPAITRPWATITATASAMATSGSERGADIAATILLHRVAVSLAASP